WNFINVRRTMAAQRMTSEAGYRFARGVHPAMAPRGVRRGLGLMLEWAGGLVYQGLADNYPLPLVDPLVEITLSDVRRWLGIDLSVEQIAGLLRSLEFGVEVDGQIVRAQTPDHRLDIRLPTTGWILARALSAWPI
ncbi:MAG: phenylalanyl-tRNA synthetase beta chain, partial [Chloroflexi bacterium]|nr:phenylalanyl-tRNA synthetase beta chain [Chloroflexota bacterium]